MGSFAAPFAFPLGGYGGRPATLGLSIEVGARVTYSWRTNVLTAWDGTEQRIALLARPRRRFEFTCLMSDDEMRATFGNLAQYAATAPAFLLALAYEDLTIDSVAGADVTVTSGALALADWATDTQHVVVVAKDGSFDDTLIASVADPTLTLESALATAEPGARIMPGLVVYLEETQQLSHYKVNVAKWQLTAIARDFDFGVPGAIEPGAGASLDVFDSRFVWTKGVVGREAQRNVIAGYDMMDLGFSARPVATWEQAVWGRTLRIESRATADWQYLKKFLHTVLGRQKAFLLPSGHPDLVAIGDASTGTLTVDSSANYVDAWWPSVAHRRIAIVLESGAVVYRTVTDAEDNGDGTQSLTLSSAQAGTIASVQFLELVRLESDDVTVEWSGNGFACEMTARVVQQ